MERNTKVGVAGGLAVIGVTLAHSGDDILRLARTTIGHEAGTATVIVRPLAIERQNIPTHKSAFQDVVANSAANLARDKHSNIQFELASGKLKIGSSRRINSRVTVGYREINIYNTAAVAGTPLAACWAMRTTRSERFI